MTAVAVWMDRQPTAVINNDSDVNLNYTRARKNIWKNFWLIVLWLNTAFAAVILAASFLADNMGWMILTGSMVYALATLLLCIPLMKQLRKIEAVYEAKRELNDNADDGRHWIWGIFYYNPAGRAQHGAKESRNGNDYESGNTGWKRKCYFGRSGTYGDDSGNVYLADT